MFQIGNAVRYVNNGKDKSDKALAEQYDSIAIVYAVEGYWMKLWRLDGGIHVASVCDEWVTVELDWDTINEQETILGLMGYG
jgi:hypothetical protein